MAHRCRGPTQCTQPQCPPGVLFVGIPPCARNAGTRVLRTLGVRTVSVRYFRVRRTRGRRGTTKNHCMQSEQAQFNDAEHDCLTSTGRLWIGTDPSFDPSSIQYFGRVPCVRCCCKQARVCLTTVHSWFALFGQPGVSETHTLHYTPASVLGFRQVGGTADSDLRWYNSVAEAKTLHPTPSRGLHMVSSSGVCLGPAVCPKVPRASERRNVPPGPKKKVPRAG